MKGMKTGGRESGTPNKITHDLKEFYKELLEGERENIKTALEDLRTDDSYKYLMAIDKIASKVVPTKKDVTTGGQQIENKPIYGVRIIEEIRPK